MPRQPAAHVGASDANPSAHLDLYLALHPAHINVAERETVMGIRPFFVCMLNGWRLLRDFVVHIVIPS